MPRRRILFLRRVFHISDVMHSRSSNTVVASNLGSWIRGDRIILQAVRSSHARHTRPATASSQGVASHKRPKRASESNNIPTWGGLKKTSIHLHPKPMVHYAVMRKPPSSTRVMIDPHCSMLARSEHHHFGQASPEFVVQCHIRARSPGCIRAAPKSIVLLI